MAYTGVMDDLRACCNLQRPARMPLFAIGLEFDMRVASITRRQTRVDVDRTVQYHVDTIRRFDYD